MSETLSRLGLNRLENFTTHIGKVISWLTIVMVITMTTVVILRYGFNIGWIWLQESVLYLHSFILMLAMSFTLQQDEHVRVDIFYRKMTATKKDSVNLFGHIFFLIPTCTYILVMSWNYVIQSWQITESSQEAGGLPLVFILKTLLILMPLLLIIQGISEVIKIVIKKTASLNEELR